MTAGELKKRREALALSQSEMARVLRVPLRTYQNWESVASAKFPSQPELLDLALRYVEQNPEFVEERITQKPTPGERGVII